MTDDRDKTYTQLPDGRWVPAQPLPYYRDTRSFWRKLWHVVRFIYIPFIRDKSKREAAAERAEKIMDEWMVPVEPYTDENGKWHRF